MQCEDCKKEYWTVDSCTFPYVSIEGKVYSRKQGYSLAGEFAKDLKESLEEKQCDDCGVTIGKVHHAGCTMEECPVCAEVMATCACDEVKTQKDRYGK